MTRTVLAIQLLSVGTYSPHIDCYNTSDVSSHRHFTPSIIFPHRSLASPASFVLKKNKKKTTMQVQLHRAQPDGRETEGTASTRSLIMLEPWGRLMGQKKRRAAEGRKGNVE